MDRPLYKRVDWSRLAWKRRADDAGEAAPTSSGRIRLWLILPLSIIFCITQAVVTIGASNINDIYMTSTLIPVLGFVVLMAFLLLLNPLMRLIRLIAPLNRAELMSLFASMLVTAGIATFGLTDQLIPLVSAPWNPDWNVPQAGWSKDAIPHLNPKLYLHVADDAPAEEKAEALETIEAAMGQHAPSQAALNNLRLVLDGTHIENDAYEQAVTALKSKLAGEAEPIMATLTVSRRHTADARVIQFFRESAPVREPVESDSLGTWVQYYKKVFLTVPWGAWARPLAYWAVFIFAMYGAFYCLAYVVLGHWMQRDKLIFPLARLPASLISDSDDSKRWIPSTFTSTGFWVGFAISFLVLSYNAMASANWLAGMPKINLGLNSAHVSAITNVSMLEGLRDGVNDLAFLIIFTAIGISFLLPVEVSFSIWFYFWVGKIIILAGTWMGYGRTGADFPSDWLWETNAVTSLGAGGLFFFSAVSLLRSILEYVRLSRGKAIGQRLRLFFPVIGLSLFLTIVVGWICWNWWSSPGAEGSKLNMLFWAVVFVLFLTLLTLGLMRIVAESGVYWYQNWGGSFFHFYKVFGLAGALKSTLVAPLLPIYSVLFLDIKTFIAPNILNAGKIQEDVGGNRTKYHVNVIVCIVITVVFSLAGAIYLGHHRGANQMSSWFYTSFPKMMFDASTKAAKTVEAEPDVKSGAWYAAGGGWVAVTMVLRRSVFWFPHPIGFIMMNNQLTSRLWFSFFIGWVAKALVVRYGGKMTFDKVRLIFIGLILGELMAVFVWPMISLLTGVEIGSITMNRYGT